MSSERGVRETHRRMAWRAYALSELGTEEEMEDKGRGPRPKASLADLSSPAERRPQAESAQRRTLRDALRLERACCWRLGCLEQELETRYKVHSHEA